MPRPGPNWHVKDHRLMPERPGWGAARNRCIHMQRSLGLRKRVGKYRPQTEAACGGGVPGVENQGLNR